mgnify:CR=1 FL=1
MRQSSALRYLAGTALALLLSVSQVQMAAAQATAQPEETESFDVDSVDSFAGAFLAARTAETDRDYANAVKLYKKALEFDPANTEIRQRLMIAELLSGNFEAGAKIADSMKDNGP